MRLGLSSMHNGPSEIFFKKKISSEESGDLARLFVKRQQERFGDNLEKYPVYETIPCGYKREDFSWYNTETERSREEKEICCDLIKPQAWESPICMAHGLLNLI